MKTQDFVCACAALAALGCAADAPSPDGETAEDTLPVTVADGLNGPMGVLVDDDGNVWIAESGTGGEQETMSPIPGGNGPVAVRYGATARILRIAPDGSIREEAVLPSFMLGDQPYGAAGLAIVDGVLYASSGGRVEGASGERLPNVAAVVRVADGQVTEVANTWDIERSENPAGAVVETNPWGLAAGPDGMLWLADAAGNTLWRIDPASGALQLAAVFEAMPGPIPNPARGGALEIEPVPTGVAVGGNGEVFVSLLPGMPFLPGSAKVVRVSADGVVSDHATGLTMLTDLAVGPDGRLYAVSLGEFTERGPTPNSGAVLRIGPDTTSEAVLSGLSAPTAIAFDRDGNAYVTLNGAGPPGTGRVMRYPGVARRSGAR